MNALSKRFSREFAEETRVWNFGRMGSPKRQVQEFACTFDELEE